MKLKLVDNFYERYEIYDDHVSLYFLEIEKMISPKQEHIFQSCRSDKRCQLCGFNYLSTVLGGLNHHLRRHVATLGQTYTLYSVIEDIKMLKILLCIAIQ